MLSKILIPCVLLFLFAMSVLAQGNRFTNELKGYEFFGAGKLNGLELLVSTKADVVKIMGKGCENGCDYDEDWKVSFSYVSSNWSKPVGDLIYKPEAELVGRLAGITLRPKGRILLSESSVFPKEFKCGASVTTAASLKYRSRTCIDDKRVLYLISNETISNGTDLILDQQIICVGYLTSEKEDDEIYALAGK